MISSQTYEHGREKHARSFGGVSVDGGGISDVSSPF